MAASHLTAASVAVALDRDAAERAKDAKVILAMEQLIAAAERLAKVAGIEHLYVDLGTCAPVFAAVSGRDEWSTTVNPGSVHGKPFGVARSYRGAVTAEVFGPDIPHPPEIAPATNDNPITFRVGGL